MKSLGKILEEIKELETLQLNLPLNPGERIRVAAKLDTLRWVLADTKFTRDEPKQGCAPADVVINQKDAVARATKVPMHLLPAAGAIHGAMACWNGAIKKGYGAYNWRTTPISYMEMIGAMERHIAALKDRENHAGDSRVHHLGHINACTAILLDAEAYGTLIDDRPLGQKNSHMVAPVLLQALPELVMRDDNAK